MARRAYSRSYTAPAKDSPRAQANATMFLASARSIEHVTVESLAGDYRLSPKVAECLLVQAKQRRERA